MSDGFSTWDAIITLSFVLVPLVLAILFLRVISTPTPQSAYSPLPDDYCRIDTYAARPRYHATTACLSEDTIVRKHSSGGNCQCIHCRRGLTVIRATGPCGVH